MLNILLAIFLAVSPTSVTASVPIQEPLEPNIAQMIYLAELAKCESGGKTDIKVLDTNGYYSYGAFQYQLNTWLVQSKNYGLDYIKKDIFDLDKQVKLTHLLLSDKQYFHWKTCNNRIGRDYPQMDLLK